MPTRPLPAVLLDIASHCLQVWLPNGVFQDSQYVARNLSGDAGTGLQIDLRTGFWFDDESSQTGHGLVELYAAVRGYTVEAAEAELTREYLEPRKPNGRHPPEAPALEPIAAPSASEAVVREIPAELPAFLHTSEAWEHFGIERGPGGHAWGNLKSALAIVSRHPDTATSLWFDEFHQRLMWGEREFEARDASELCLMMQRTIGVEKMSTTTAREAAETHGMRNPRHPVREWLESLPKWNGLRHLEELLPVGFGTADDDYHAQVGRCFLIGMVARVMRPGCQLDTMPVFEGSQGIGKTSALRVLGGDWYSSNNAGMQEKDFLQGLQGYWLIEIEELESVNRASLERTKAILSRVRDEFRWSHGRQVKSYLRQCVFAATTNSSSWNADSSGARRFWPVACEEIDLAWIRRMREHLFAEALARFRSGEDWHRVPVERAVEEQEARRVEDPWAAILEAKLAGLTEYTIEDAFAAIEAKPNEREQRHARRIAEILKSLGWRVHVRKVNGRSKRLYRPMEPWKLAKLR
jgi:Virulence-associated protein E